jgi:hypothetical protein
MAEVLVGFVFPQPIEIVWRATRDFKSICSWLPNASNCQIENGLAVDQVGAIRRFSLGGSVVREQLLALSDQDHSCSYSLLQGPLPVQNLVGSFRLYSITETGGTFGQWGAAFEVNEQLKDNAVLQLTNLYAGGWANLKKLLSS